jgi:hypothetical protein
MCFRGICRGAGLPDAASGTAGVGVAGHRTRSSGRSGLVPGGAEPAPWESVFVRRPGERLKRCFVCVAKALSSSPTTLSSTSAARSTTPAMRFQGTLSECIPSCSATTTPGSCCVRYALRRSVFYTRSIFGCTRSWCMVFHRVTCEMGVLHSFYARPTRTGRVMTAKPS